MNDDPIAQRVITHLARISGRDASSIQPTDRLDELLVDSLDLVEIVMSFEDEFGLKGDSPEPNSIKTVADLIEWIRRSR